jgi:hypothetical protein
MSWTKTQLIAERRRRSDIKNSLLGSLHEKQRAFALDPARRKSALTTRRAGKTYADAIALILSAIERPGSINPFVTLSRPVAKRIMWPVLKQLNRDHNLNASINASDLAFSLPGGGQVWCTGVDDDDSVEKLRGSAYPCVAVDECASMGGKMQALVDDVLGPALLDYNGALLLTGTPSAICAGYFFDVTNGMPGWSVHKWSVLDNTYLPDAKAYINQLITERQWDENNPTYMREWRGLWVKSIETLVYKYRKDCIVDALPAGEYTHVLGGDIGFDDACALVMASWAPSGDGVLYLHSEWRQNKLDVTSFGEKIKEYRSRYKFRRIVIDRGGLGKMIVEELNNRHGVNANPAEKADKPGAIELLNEDLRRGRVKIVGCQKLIEEWDSLQWSDPDRKIEDDRFDNHCSDASLYAYRESRHYRAKAPPPKDMRSLTEIEQEKYKRKLEAQVINKASSKYSPKYI